MATESVSRGVTIQGARVKVWVECNLQPARYNQITVGASVEDDVPKGRAASTVVGKSFDSVLKDLQKKIRVAFAKCGFKFEGGQ